ncbi:MAG: MutH/Sau3AI family endonuclease [Polyangia bacterium]|nr:MutH/Sau3AI family endonuclease [Polyangia bacterium]
MRANPPRTEDELLGRALSLEGRRLGPIAEGLGLRAPADLRRNKGWVGELLELALGAAGGAAAACDFPDLGVELKTVPLDERGRPRESTCVCVASLGPESLASWEDCWLRAKLARVLWVPVLGRGAPGSRVVGRARLWSPSVREEALLRADWEELSGQLGLGRFDELDARWGEVLQLRPKAASSRERRWAMSAEAEWVQVNPRGFYLRARFVARVLSGLADLDGTPPNQ